MKTYLTELKRILGRLTAPGPSMLFIIIGILGWQEFLKDTDFMTAIFVSLIYGVLGGTLEKIINSWSSK